MPERRAGPLVQPHARNNFGQFARLAQCFDFLSQFGRFFFAVCGHQKVQLFVAEYSAVGTIELVGGDNALEGIDVDLTTFGVAAQAVGQAQRGDGFALGLKLRTPLA